jgi:redox-sensitive bicupin YhaK (pirin superfamily)
VSELVSEPSASIDVRPAASRFHTDLGWLDSWHSFNFGHHHDGAHAQHGLLLVSNDDWVRAGTGFGTHPHRDMEIVTWVLAGQLEHRDTTGAHGILYPGLAQRMSAGSGVRHSEMNPSATEDVRLIQMWVLPDEASVEPSYQQADVNDALAGGGLVPIASGQGHDGGVSIHQRGAVLWGGRLAAGATVPVPDDRHVHLFVATGEATLEGGGLLVEGDAARLTEAGSPALTAGAAGAEVLIWATT